MASAIKQWFRRRFQRWITHRIPPQQKITLNQRNIFILPSVAGGYFIVFLLLLLVVAVNYQNTMAFAFVFFMASVFVVSILHTYLNLSGLCIEVVHSNNAFVGECVDIEVRFSSDHFRYHHGIHCYWGESFESFSLADHDKEYTGCFYLKASRRGQFTAPRLLIETYYPLGLLRAWTWLAPKASAVVYPLPIEHPWPADTASSAEDEGDSRVKMGGDDFYGFINYQAGHSLKRVYWPSFAKGQPLQTQYFTESSHRQYQLNWDAFTGDLEQRLSYLCYWILQLSEKNQSFSVSLPNQQFGPDSGQKYRQTLLYALAVFGEQDQNSPKDRLKGERYAR